MTLSHGFEIDVRPIKVSHALNVSIKPLHLIDGDMVGDCVGLVGREVGIEKVGFLEGELVGYAVGGELEGPIEGIDVTPSHNCPDKLAGETLRPQK